VQEMVDVLKKKQYCRKSYIGPRHAAVGRKGARGDRTARRRSPQEPPATRPSLGLTVPIVDRIDRFRRSHVRHRFGDRALYSE